MPYFGVLGSKVSKSGEFKQYLKFSPELRQAFLNLSFVEREALMGARPALRNAFLALSVPEREALMEIEPSLRDAFLELSAAERKALMGVEPFLRNAFLALSVAERQCLMKELTLEEINMYLFIDPKSRKCSFVETQTLIKLLIKAKERQCGALSAHLRKIFLDMPLKEINAISSMTNGPLNDAAFSKYITSTKEQKLQLLRGGGEK